MKRQRTQQEQSRPRQRMAFSRPKQTPLFNASLFFKVANSYAPGSGAFTISAAGNIPMGYRTVVAPLLYGLWVNLTSALVSLRNRVPKCPLGAGFLSCTSDTDPCLMRCKEMAMQGRSSNSKKVPHQKRKGHPHCSARRAGK